MTHKVEWGPGYRFFECEECGFAWKTKSRDCESPSGESCERCDNEVSPSDHEKHYEWPTDGSGNLTGEEQNE